MMVSFLDVKKDCLHPSQCLLQGLKKKKKLARPLFSRHRLAEGGTLTSGQDTSTAAQYATRK